MEKFRFKQFEVQQSQSAMKIGNDAVLLGAWCELKEDTNSVLDIGAGTGVVSLILAQRLAESSGHFDIEAIEIEDEAHIECSLNFDNSPWSDHLFCYHASLVEFAQEMDEHYDLIVCNPPFYKDFDGKEITPRALARSATFMPLPHIFAAAEKLCTPESGEIAIVLPHDQKEEALHIANVHGFYPKRILNLRGTAETPYKRVFIQWNQKEVEALHENLTLETDRHKYTTEYLELVKDFYLNL